MGRSTFNADLSMGREDPTLVWTIILLESYIKIWKEEAFFLCLFALDLTGKSIHSLA